MFLAIGIAAASAQQVMCSSISRLETMLDMGFPDFDRFCIPWVTPVQEPPHVRVLADGIVISEVRIYFCARTIVWVVPSKWLYRLFDHKTPGN
jgi:hypothetical protein